MKKYVPENYVEQDCINHLKFLENPITDISIIMPNFNTIENKYTHIYLKQKLNDINKIKNIIQNENEIQAKQILEIDHKNIDIVYELKIVKKEKDEIIADKNNLEEELSKIKVINNKLARML
jgi:hypothetical protein